jgi:hypothetical protein
METIMLFDAVREMRKLTAHNRPFSIVHATLNRQTQQSNGIRAVRKAILRPAAKADDVELSDHKLFYLDMEDNSPRVAWQPLLMYFEGKKIVLE